MGNFEFLKVQWPTLYAEARAAERDALFDARTTCFYARRTVEHVVEWIYRVENLPEPYRSDLAARIHEPLFSSIVGQSLQQKMTLIRKLGNAAVHESRPVAKDKGVIALSELFHIMSWLARTYGKEAESRPDPRTQFDLNLLPKPSGQAMAKSVAQITKLNTDLAARDADLKAAAELNANLEAELVAARAELAAAKAANKKVPDDHDYGEVETRQRFIDVDLLESGWTLNEPRAREFEVMGMPGGKKGYVDYVLWGADGLPLALVEAKRTAKDAIVGQQQAKLYADCLEQMCGRRPIIYYSNGVTHHIWDDELYPPRKIAGFHTADQLELLIARRKTRKTLADYEIATSIVDRPYQHRAIRRVLERFEVENQREALLVMATGAGKTRTVIALSDVLTRANWAKRVLFLADRVALVNQAVNAFKTVLPDSAPVNLITEKKTDGRVYVATYPTMMGLINQVDDSQRRFGPGYFDLVIIDEAHRSVYQKYRHIFAHFDSLLLGLTATPKDDVDQNTYQLFNLENGVPTDNYSLDEAIADHYLVPPAAFKVDLQFPRRGVKYDDLSDQEKDAWDAAEWGETDDDAPDEVSAEAVNKWLFNIDTADKALKVLMEKGHKVAGGDRLAKTIIFARNNDHAHFLAERFNANYPEFKGEFARVITYSVNYAQSLIDDFSRADKAPHIAISVDMLDTGIDVPEVTNLVFFKPVRSKTKFWQMVGRGTRLCPDLFGPGMPKTDFRIFDLCGNFEFFDATANPPETKNVKSLSERIFTGRVDLVSALDRAKVHTDLRNEAVETLVEQVAGMNFDNIIVKPKRDIVEKYRDRARWDSLNEQMIAEIINDVAPLPTAVRDADEAAKRFDLMVIRGQVALLSDDSIDKQRAVVQQIADGLLEKLNIPEIGKREELLRDVASDEWWIDVTVPMLEVARKRLRSIVGLLEKAKQPIIYSNFEDTLLGVDEVAMPTISVGTDEERFNAKVRMFLAQQPQNLALQKLKTARPLTDADLESLQTLLTDSGVGEPDDFDRAIANAQGLGRFIRSLVGLDRHAAQEALAEFSEGRTLTANQNEVIRLIIEHLTRHGVMAPGLLFEPPFTDSAPHGLTQIFDGDQSRRIVDVLKRINDSADTA